MPDGSSLDAGPRELSADSRGPDEVVLSCRPTGEAARARRPHPGHVLAQRSGRERWYESYSVQVAKITREYRTPA